MYCPTCHHYNDPTLTPSGRTPPKDWDPIQCVSCHTILCIDHTHPGGLRLPSTDDWHAWQAEPRIATALAHLGAQQREDTDP